MRRLVIIGLLLFTYGLKGQESRLGFRSYCTWSQLQDNDYFKETSANFRLHQTLSFAHLTELGLAVRVEFGTERRGFTAPYRASDELGEIRVFEKGVSYRFDYLIIPVTLDYHRLFNAESKTTMYYGIRAGFVTAAMTYAEAYQHSIVLRGFNLEEQSFNITGRPSRFSYSSIFGLFIGGGLGEGHNLDWRIGLDYRYDNTSLDTDEFFDNQSFKLSASNIYVGVDVRLNSR